MKKIYIKPFTEFEEIEESLLYRPSIKAETTTDEDPDKDGPETGGDTSDDDLFN